MMELVEKFVFPNNISKAGFFSKNFRVISESHDGHAIERVIEAQISE